MTARIVLMYKLDLRYFIDKITGSPLVKRAELRRERSRSRQRMESNLARAAEDIPEMRDVMEYVSSTYNVIKV